MKIMIHKEKSSHITFHGEKELITSHENILYHPPLCCFSPFIQSYVVVLRPCQLLEFYPNRTLLEEHEWSGMGVNKTEPFQLLSKLFSLSISIIFSINFNHLRNWQTGKFTNLSTSKTIN